VGNFLTKWKPVSFWRRDLFHGVIYQFCIEYFDDIIEMFSYHSNIIHLWAERLSWIFPHTPQAMGAVRFLSTRCGCVLGAFAKLRKATISFVRFCLPVRLCVRMEELSSHWTDFYQILYIYVFFENPLKKFHFD